MAGKTARSERLKKNLPEWLSWEARDIISFWISLLVQEKKAGVLVDLDETVFSTYWAFMETIILAQLVNHPACERILEEKYIDHHELVDLLGGMEMAEAMFVAQQHSIAFNQHSELMELELEKILGNFTQEAFLLGGLTARPDTQPVKQATWQAMENAKLDGVFHQAPILFYDGPRPDSSQWKKQVLSELVSAIQRGLHSFEIQETPLIMVDDDTRIAPMVYELNQRVGGNYPPLVFINYLATQRAQQRRSQIETLLDVPLPLCQRGIHVAESWQQVTEIIRQTVEGRRQVR
jgi:hypothetical protein